VSVVDFRNALSDLLIEVSHSQVITQSVCTAVRTYVHPYVRADSADMITQ
jgi:hypothetical protein